MQTVGKGDARRLPLLVRQPQFILDLHCICPYVRLVCLAIPTVPGASATEPGPDPGPGKEPGVPHKVGIQQNGAHKQKALTHEAWKAKTATQKSCCWHIWLVQKKKNKNEKVKAKTIPDARKLRIQWRAKSRTYKQIHSHKGKQSERWCRVHLEKTGVGHKIIFLEFEKEKYYWYII